jgi:galactokinase
MLEESEIRRRFVDFETRFGRGGVIDLYYAPGRVNLIGDHTDYNGGYVLPFAVEQGTYLMIRKSELSPARLYSENLDLDARIMPADTSKAGDWADYVRGVCLFAREYCDELSPFDALYFGDLPLDAGLSSSASIEIVTSLGMETLGCPMNLDQVVKVSLRAENDFVGVQSGILDQFAVAHAQKGHALFLNCETLEYRQVPFNLKEAALVVGHTGLRRSVLETEYRTRKLESEQALELLTKKLGTKRNLTQISINEFERARYSLPPVLEKRAEHVVYENVRVEEAARCLEAGDPETLGHLMNRSHESLRDLYEASCPELDALQEISMNQQGVWGCRMTGAGFGGCVVTLMKKSSVENYLRRLPRLYWQATHYDADFIVTVPGDGAKKL